MTITFQTKIFQDARFVRTKVFIDEQGFSEEFDQVDELESTLHITLYLDGKLAGCTRVFPENTECSNSEKWIFGRLAVLPEMRKDGLGGILLSESERLAKQSGATELHLHAQCRVVSFYEKHGYRSYGTIELDEHVEHIWMSKML